jgi:hypothetical protein
MSQSINARRAAYAKRRADNAATAALAARGPPMSPDHPPEAEGDDDRLLNRQHDSERLSRSWYHSL